MPATLPDTFGDWVRAHGQNRLGLGCWRLCAPGRPPRRQAIDTIRAAYDAGVRIFDTADSYGLDFDEHGYGEVLLRDALSGCEGVVVVTKGGYTRPGGRWCVNGSPDWLARAIDDSLLRLGRDSIDCYLLHGVDSRVDIFTSLGPILAAQKDGRIRWIGVSNVSLAQARSLVEAHHIDVIQNRLSLTVVPPETSDMLGLCEAMDILFMPYTPFGPTLDEGRRCHVSNHPDIRRVADDHRTSPEVITLAWLLKLSDIISPIPGARRAESIHASLSATGIALSQRDMEQLSAIAGFTRANLNIRR